MAVVRNNILTNLFSSVWSVVLTAAITPVQVRLLGIEAYGVIGFIATLQVVFAAFDLGLSTTLTRQLAADRSDQRVESNELIQTVSTVYWGIAIIVGIVLALAAHHIAEDWFKAQDLSPATLRQSLYLIILYLALRWPTALYAGILGGVQKMVAINIIKFAVVTVRLAGGIVVLLIWRDLAPFLLWNALTALAEVFAYSALCRRAFPLVTWGPGISVAALKPLVGFSSAMMAISLLALFISQLDRVFVSKLLSLEQFGFYMLAYNTASIASLAIAAVATAMLPSFAAWQAEPQIAILHARYDQANRVILFIVGAATWPLIFFGHTILFYWVGATASDGAYRPMALLAAALWLNALISNAYTTSVALGRPTLTLKVSAISAIPYAMTLYFMVGRWQLTGAAGAWLLLNLAYVFALVPIVHRNLLDLSTARWLKTTLFPFAALGLGTFGAARLIRDMVTENSMVANLGVIALGTIAYGLGGYYLLGARVRDEVANIVTGRLRSRESV